MPILGTFSQFWGQKKISQKIWVYHAQLHMRFSCHAPCQNLEKIYEKIPRKCPDRKEDRRMDWRMDRPYFIGPSGCDHGSKMPFNDIMLMTILWNILLSEKLYINFLWIFINIVQTSVRYSIYCAHSINKQVSQKYDLCLDLY